MTATLSDLFDQIIHSERLAQDRKQRLQEVKSKIQLCHENLISTREEWESQRGRQVLKIQQLNEEELKLKWLSNREGILREQKLVIIQEKIEFDQKMEDVVKCFDAGLQRFIDDVTKFMMEFDLLGKGSQKRELAIKEETSKLDEKEKPLSVVVDDYEDHIKDIESLLKKKTVLEGVISILFVENEEKSQEISEEMSKIKSLEEQKLSVSHIPQNDDEFCGLRSKVSQLMSRDLEQEYLKLQQDVNNLQHILRRKQLHKDQKRMKMGKKQKIDKISEPFPSNYPERSHLVSSQHQQATFAQTCVLEDSQVDECETSNRLCITSYPPSTTTDYNKTQKERN